MDHSKAAEQAIRDASARRQALGLVTLIYAAAGFVVRAIYQSARGRVAEVALRSDSGAIDFIALLPKVEKWERVK